MTGGFAGWTTGANSTALLQTDESIPDILGQGYANAEKLAGYEVTAQTLYLGGGLLFG